MMKLIFLGITLSFLGQAGGNISVKKYEQLCLNNFSGCTDLAILYIQGKHVKRNYKKAIKYLTIACHRNKMEGCKYLAAMYNLGKGVKINKQESKKILIKVCNNKDAEGCELLAEVYNDLKDDKKASIFYELSCNYGNALGCLKLASSYYYAKNKNYEKAAVFYQKALDKGLLDGANALAGMYYKGIGVKKDYKKAIKLYQKACKGNIGNSCDILRQVKDISVKH